MKPIIFSTPMVQAILDGRKTQTRRVVKINGYPITSPDESLELTKEGLIYHSINSMSGYYKPPCQPGDILWVREAWSEHQEYYNNSAKVFAEPHYIYKADGVYANKWRPSIFMPREAARLFLRVKTVRVERLQEITLEDIEHEGLYCDPPYTKEHYAYEPGMRIHWIKLWDSLNAKRGYGWDTNPWVWVIEFEKISKEEAERFAKEKGKDYICIWGKEIGNG